MHIIFNTINSETFTKAINSEIAIAVIGIILTAFVTYYVNKLAALSPRKQEIFRIRLEKVLLPLQKHFTYTAIKFDNHQIHINKVNHIYKKHMVYISLNMQLLINKLNRHISMPLSDKNKATQKLINAIQAQTNYEYELVRSKLRLPSKRLRFDDFLFATILRNTYSLDTFVDWVMSLILTSCYSLVISVILYKYFLYQFPLTTALSIVFITLETLALIVSGVTIIIIYIIKLIFWFYNFYKLRKKSTVGRKK